MTGSATPPQNLDAERAVLGTVLLAQSIPDDLVAPLEPDHFYSPAHGAIFRAMQSLHSAGTPVTVITIDEHFKSNPRSDITAFLLTGLPDYAMPESIDVHARIVVEKAQQRRLIVTLAEAQSQLYNDGFDNAGVHGVAEGLLKELKSFSTISATPNSTARQAVTIKIADVQRETVTWLWQDRIPIGKLTMVEGNPGLGKSWLTLAIAAAVSSGAALPGDFPRPPANVILMSAEDGLGDTIRPRLEDLGADLSRVIALKGMTDDAGHEGVITLSDLDVLEQVIIRDQPALVIVDPIIAYIAGKDTSRANEVRSILSPLAALAEKHGCALVAVRHLNKGNAQALYRGQGSIDFIAAARAAFVVGENPDDATERVLCHLKHNLAPKTPSLAFTIEAGVLRWRGHSDLTAEQILAAPAPGDERNATEEAMEWLKTQLSDGPRPAAQVQKEARAARIQEKPLRRARERLGITPKKGGFAGGWTWGLAGLAAQPARQDAQDARSIEQGILASSGHLREKDRVWEDVS